MNCCTTDGITCPPCNHDCNQSDSCPARITAEPSPRKNTCAQLGVCHCETPECSDTTSQPAPLVGWDDVHPEDPDGDGVWEEISFWGSHIAVAMMTVVVVAGSAGYLYIKLGG